MCAKCVGVVLQRIDFCERVIFLLHEGHMYFVCGPGLNSLSLACARSARRTLRAREHLAHVTAARGRLTEKTIGVRPPLGCRAKVS